MLRDKKPTSRLHRCQSLAPISLIARSMTIGFEFLSISTMNGEFSESNFPQRSSSRFFLSSTSTQYLHGVIISLRFCCQSGLPQSAHPAVQTVFLPRSNWYCMSSAMPTCQLNRGSTFFEVLDPEGPLLRLRHTLVKWIVSSN